MAAADKIFQDAIASLNIQKPDDAERLFKKFLKVQPNHIGALNLLTVTLMSMKRFAEAERFILKAVTLNQSSDVSFYNYGIILKNLGKPRQALEQFDHALKINSQVCETWNNRGTVLNDLQRYELAISDFDKAIALNRNYFESYCNKGKSLSKLKRFDEALEAYDKALALKSDLAEARLGRGNVFTKLRRYDEAFAAYDKALALKPDLAEAWLGRGNVFTKLRRHDEAFAAYDKALALKADLAEAWLGRGNVFAELKRHDDALAAYDKALAVKADLAEAWLGRGNVFTKLRRHDDALAALDKAFALEPDLDLVEGARLHSKMNLCDWNNFSAECEHLISSVKNKNVNSSALAFVGISSSPKDQIECAKLWVANICPRSEKPIWKGEIYKHDRIRVAYLSADFHDHPVSYLMANVFEQHNRQEFETFAISFGPDNRGEMRMRLEGAFDHFIDVQSQNDADAGRLLRALEIDIAVDLMGFTGDSRTAIMAQRPAPIQVNYLGYPGTMGASYIDYLIADPVLIPSSQQKNYTEKIAYLPNSFIPNDGLKRSISGRPFSRAEFGLPEAGFVFCCFNNAFKLNPHLFETWMKILKTVTGSVLWLSDTNATAVSNLKKEAAATGINPDRLIFAKRLPSSADHLARHRLADLFLDTLPYNAHTTASDALWAGLPVLTQIGETFAGRVAASLLTAIGLPELITTTQKAYENLAIELATNSDKLTAIKSKLANNRLTTPLFDTRLFTRHIEAAYTAMYERLQAGLPPEHICVPQ